MEANDIVIVAGKRTPMGTMLGELSSLTAPQLASAVNKAVLAESGLAGENIDEVIAGCVLQAGIGQAPARQGAMLTGIPASVGATTINKMCGSGMKSVMLAHDLIKTGSAKTVLAGGMESMSNAPYLLKKARAGYRLGHGEIKDHMLLDGLEDAYEPGRLMGYYAEKTAEKYGFTREQQDDFAKRSLNRAIKANENGGFATEITPVAVKTRKAETTVSKDEEPDASKLEKISQLRPAFQKDGTVTAANASSISDGAASLILTSYAHAQQQNLTPLARIVSHSSHAQEPEWFTTAPVEAVKKVLMQAGWGPQEVDLYEINEAFAVVTMAAMTELELNEEQVNIYGGACALGHPIGASGARIIVTLLNALTQNNKTKGVASLCIGGGEATAVAIEMLSTS